MQNETVDIFGDGFGALADEDLELGNKADAELRELQSFSHLQYCSDRQIIHCDWQPTGSSSSSGMMVIGVSCARMLSFEQRLFVSGKVHTGYVLLWSFSDPLTPQHGVEAPGDVHRLPS